MHGGNTWNTHDPTHITEQYTGKDLSRGAVYLKKLPQAPNPGLFESGVCSSLTLKHANEKREGSLVSEGWSCAGQGLNPGDC